MTPGRTWNELFAKRFSEKYSERLARWGAAGAVALAAAAGVLRWVAMAFDPSLALLWPLQATLV